MNIVQAALVAAGDDQQKAAPLGLLVLLLLGVACYFLFKSMSRHLKRVREDFPARSGATTPATSRPVPAARPPGEASGPSRTPTGADDGAHPEPD